jgi:putative membrane protein
VDAPPEPTWPAVLARWSVEPAAVALLALAAVLYVRGRQAGAAVGDDVPWRFWAGLGVVAVALLSPVSAYAHALLSVHMVQHLLLAFVAAPLLVSSGAGGVLLAGAPAPVAAAARRVAGSRAYRAATSPLAGWLAFAAAGWLIHFSPLFDLALRQEQVHAFEHAVFLGTGLLFWLPVLGRRFRLSAPMRLLYLALGMPQNTFLALAIFSAGRPLYDAYEGLARTWGPSVLDDQRLGGGIMWVAGDLTLLVAVLLVAARWATAEMASP